MKYLCVVALILLAFLVTHQYALVHHIELTPTPTGCMGKTELAVGELEDDDNVCGAVVCQDLKGNALIHYCQSIPSFQYCSTELAAISTSTHFPDCCWQCIKFKECDEETGNSEDQVEE